LRRWIIGDVAGARSIQAEAMALAERYGRPFAQQMQALQMNTFSRAQATCLQARGYPVN
jgi:hypothetical protein